MAFNFPDAPAEDQVFTPSGGPTYIYKSPRWLVQMAPAAAGVTTDDAAPSSPVDGQLWYKSNTGDTYIWYVDPSGVPGQWVQVNVMPATGSSPVATAQTRNRVCNPAMQISQENGSAETGSPNAYWPADQWSVSAGGATNAKMLAVRLANISTPYGSPYRLRMRTVAVVVPTASEFVSWNQAIEGIKIADFQWGTANAKKAVLRFGFRGPAATYSIAVRNSDATLGYAQTFTISAGQADIDTEQLFVIPAPTTGTFANDTGKGIQIYVTLCGTGYLTAPGSWTVGNFVGATGMTNSLPNGAFFYLFDVGLYLDPQNTGVAPAWQMPDEAEELRACQRYYYKTDTTAGSSPGTFLGNFYGPAGVGNMYAGTMQFPVPMRTAPAIVTLLAPTLVNCSAFAFAASDTLTVTARVTVTALGGYRAWGGQYAANARM